MTPRNVIIPQKTGNVSAAAARKAVEVVMKQASGVKVTIGRAGTAKVSGVSAKVSGVSAKIIQQHLGKFGTSLGHAKPVKVQLFKEPGVTIKVPKLGRVKLQSPVVRVGTASKGIATKVYVKKARGR